MRRGAGETFAGLHGKDGGEKEKAAQPVVKPVEKARVEVSRAVQKALEHLDKWSSYQEVIRVARELKESQDRVNKDIRKAGGGK